jgi:purine-binding chemotaxis protein CheW
MDMVEEASHISRQLADAGLEPSRASEYLSFRLGAEEYGIDLLKVQEIRSYEAPTRIADAPRFVKGVLNLRGVIMPVVDLRMSFGCDSAQIDAFTVVIVLNVCNRLVGTVVDSVSDVLALPASQIRPAPAMAANCTSRFINGIASLQKRTLILMDIEALMASPLMGLVGPGATRHAQLTATLG